MIRDHIVRNLLFCCLLAIGGAGYGQDMTGQELAAQTPPPREETALQAESASGEAAAAAPSAAPAETTPAEATPASAPAETAPALPELIVSAGILVDGLQYDIPMPWGHEQFEELRASYMTSGGRKWLNAVMERALPYLAYVEEKVEEYGLPKELVYLPVIESEYSPYAVSRSGATGIWQFMRNSISGYGITISDWKDERKDFMKSTDAALKKLRDNYQALGDWLLAIAAYNAGLGAVSRAVKSSTGETIDFWHLYDSKKLSREPLSYVPKFLAVASILSYPELHGLPDGWGEPRDWEALETNRQVDLQVLSERTGIPLDLLKQGNAELRYRVTPPASSHMVKVPAESAEAARTVLSDTSTPLIKYDIYKVKSGDTMGAIAQRYRTPLDIILQANPGVKADRIKIGQTLIIPHLGTGASANASPGKGDDAGREFSATYTIKKGDTLWDISLKFNVQPDELARQNGIGMSSVLQIGAKLKVPAPAGS
ncbi:LysM peptidoglycan-binding domain-containing protein [bacterium]|nr:LysM peptidoglycan-binding domain-containing protein [bacterium]